MREFRRLASAIATLSGLCVASMTAYSATRVGDPRQALEGQVCTGQCGNSNGLLTPIHAYVPLKSIPTVPRVPGPLGFLRAVGMVEDPKRQGHGTAFLLAGNNGCYALTNFHVAFGDNPSSTQQIVTISFGQGNVNSFEAKIPARAVENGWASLPPGKERHCGDDWALLRLDTCAGDRFGGFEMSDLDGDPTNIFDMKVSMAGYPDFIDYRKGVAYEAVCPGHAGTFEAMGEVRDNELRHRCTALNYSSGSPLLVTTNGTVKVAAMNCGDVAFPGDNEATVRSLGDHTRFNTAVPMTAIADRIQKLIAADRGQRHVSSD